ncbi:MAG: ParB/RepB/Spo0J family partition protein [Brevundimonas sp.]|uniref:ParB/RepB/Spo0J family partition protein n=1 Tax=Brevundimonas sp. TaxID=1871086 RepID=UPI003919928F
MTAQITTFKLADLRLATENARHGHIYDIDGLMQLAMSLRALYRATGRALIEPLKAYADDTGGAVWDGGRRLAALNLLADDGDAEALAIIDAVPVIVTTQEEARIASAATFVREDMHPTDRFLMWNTLFDQGQTPEQIAAAVGASAKDVGQLLRFRMLAPEIFAAFKAGEMEFDAALAFTLSEDQDRQRDVLASFNGKPPRAADVRQRIKKGSVDAMDRRARWVGRVAYAKAGGTFLTDLFSHREIDETWSDEPLLQRLFDEKMAKTLADLKAEGWGHAEARDGGWGWSKGFERLTPEGAGKKGKKAFTAEQMKGGYAFVLFEYNDVKIERGWAKEKKVKGGDTAFLPPAKADPARFGFGHKGHHIMTQVATDATKVALARNPKAAADAMLAHLAWAVLRKPQYGSTQQQLASNLVVDPRFASRPDHVAVEGLFDLNCDLAAWKTRLPATVIAFCEAVAALSADDKLTLQALCYAATLDGVEVQIGMGTADRRRHLGWMGSHAGVAVDDVWTPDEAFLKGGSKEALLAAVKEADGKDMPNAKKGDLVAYVDTLVALKGWRPALLKGFMDVTDPKGDKVRADDPTQAPDEETYLAWIADALVTHHGVPGVQAGELAARFLREELERASCVFGDENYGWTRADAAGCAEDGFAADDEDNA